MMVFCHCFVELSLRYASDASRNCKYCKMGTGRPGCPAQDPT